MIRFVDVIKANKRYFYVLLTSIAVCFGLIFGLTYYPSSYNAKATIIVEKKAEVPGNEYIAANYAEIVISEVQMRTNHNDFAKKILYQIELTDVNLANELSVQNIKNCLSVNYQKGKTFFDVNVNYLSDVQAKEIADAAVKVICDEYNAKTDTQAQLTKVYSTELSANTNKRATYGVIGVLVGIVVGEIIITCILAFNPYVEDKELLERQADIEVIATLCRVRGDKNEAR